MMAPMKSSVNPSQRQPLWRMMVVLVLVSIFSHSSLMKLGWTRKERMVTRPLRVSEKWEKMGARLMLSSRCSSREEQR